MRQSILNAALLVAACGLLSACDLFSQEPDESAVDESNVSGEVLEGTISDDMLPLDQLRSAAPPAEIVPEAVGSGSAGATAPVVPDETADDVGEPEPESPPAETVEQAFAADEAAD